MSTVKVVQEAPQQNYFTGVEYQGGNATSLRLAGYKEGQWATYKQWFEHGYQVQKGEHGHSIMVVKDKDDDPSKKAVRYYKVFNVAQVKPIEVSN